jgi:hypothetical protein
MIAGTLAGLLAAGLGAYYLQLHPPATTPAAMAPAPIGAPAAPAPEPAAAPAKAVEAVPAGHTRQQAAQALMALPELKAWSAQIEKKSAGKMHGAVVEYDPAPRVVKGKRYWQLSFVENSAEAAERWESFLVSASDDEILVEDVVTDELISLKRWRKEYRPMERGNESN